MDVQKCLFAVLVFRLDWPAGTWNAVKRLLLQWRKLQKGTFSVLSIMVKNYVLFVKMLRYHLLRFPSPPQYNRGRCGVEFHSNRTIFYWRNCPNCVVCFKKTLMFPCVAFLSGTTIMKSFHSPLLFWHPNFVVETRFMALVIVPQAREAYLHFMVSIAKITREDRNLTQDDDRVWEEMMQVLELETDIANVSASHNRKWSCGMRAKEN